MLKKNKPGKCFLKTAIVISAMAILSSCSKTGSGSGSDDNNHVPVDVNDVTYPVIVIDKPLTDQVFTSGDTIKIQGLVTDIGLYQGNVKIINDANGLALLDKHYEIHGLASYNFSQAYKTSVTTVSNYTVSVDFEDHGLNVTTKTVKVKVNP
jgi:hypothetical protein